MVYKSTRLTLSPKVLRHALFNVNTRLFFIRATGIALSTLLALGIARLYGAEASGIYYLFLSIALGLSLVSRRGLDAATLKEVSISKDTTDLKSAFGCWAHSVRSALTVGAILAATLVVSQQWDHIKQHTDIPSIVLICAAIGAPFHAVHLINLGALRGLGRQEYAAFLEVILTSGLAVTAITALYVLGQTQSEVPMLVYLSVLMLTGVTGSISFWRPMRGLQPNYPDRRKLMAISRSFFVVGAGAFIIDWLGSVVLAFFVPLSDVGIYGVCLRLVAVSGIVLTIYNNLNAPVFAAAFHNEDIGKARSEAQKGAQSCFLFGSIILVPVYVFSNPLLGLVGEEFRDGSTLLRIMIAAQLFNMFTGSVGYLLLMSGNEKILRNISYLNIGVVLIIIVPVIYFYGAIGASIVWATAGIVKNALALYFSYVKTNILVVPAFLTRARVRSGARD